MLGHFLKLAMVCNRLHDVGRTCASASFQVILVADVHQSMMLSFGCFLPIVQPPFVVLKQTHTQAVALDFTYVTLVKATSVGLYMNDSEVEALALQSWWSRA